MSRTKILFAALIIFAMMSVLLAACNDVPSEPATANVLDNEVEAGGEEITDDPETPPSDDDTPPQEKDPEPILPEYLTVRAVAVGDNLIHSSIYSQANRRAGGGDNYDFRPAYENVWHLIEGHDLGLINQETLVNNVIPPSNWPHFSTPGPLGDLMIEMGFNAFNIANNHTLDLGTDGLIASLDYWAEKEEDIAVFGAYYDMEDRKNIRTLEIGGVVFSFLGYAESLNGLDSWLIPPVEVGRFGNAHMDIMLAEIEAAKAISDVCVVFLHWGLEDWNQIEPYQRTAAQRMVDAGADIIHGTHPHVLRDIEFIERESDGTQALVIYSLANFISSQIVPQTMIGGILTFDVIVNSKTRAVEIADVLLIPIITHYDPGHTNVRLYPLTDYTPELAAGHGIRNWGRFDYNYIFEILRKNVSEKFLPDGWDTNR
ncbi:MAG: CapA family protein [Oscillospiraceae bacterium]|jgi:poly-gamma-glutamate synthesis protein (capsule biosynthesis protein)|nr:CapA family protein [Oscillospiraceae bacterium]